MVCSLLVIASTTGEPNPFGDSSFFTHYVKSQLQWFAISWGAYILFASIDYHKLREWTWILYLATIVLLVGLFFTKAVGHTHRWYTFFGIGLQPSEYVKLVLGLTLSWFLEKKSNDVDRLATAWQAGIIVGIPFLLILKKGG